MLGGNNNFRGNRSNKNRGRKPRRNPNTEGSRQNVAGVTPAYMNKSIITPSYLVRRLEYKSDLSQISAGATFLVKSFVANGLYDPDPAILSTSYAGFAWLSQAYYENLVQISKTQWWIGNNTDTYVSVGITYSFDQEDTVITTWQQARDKLENAFSTPVIQLAPKGAGGCSRRIMSKISLQDMVKAGTYQFSELYAGGNATNPTTPIYVNFIMYATDGSTNLTAGLDTEIALYATAEFYSQRKLLDNPVFDYRVRRIKAEVVGRDPKGVVVQLKNSQTKLHYAYIAEEEKSSQ